jgi:hypothetical protein
MKTLTTLAFLCLLAITGCKKPSTNPSPQTANKLQIKVFNVGTYTNFLITVQNYTQKTNPVSFNGTKDTTFSVTANVGDDLNVLYNFTYVPPGTDGSAGVGSIVFYYNNQNIGGVANGVGNTSVTIPKP